MIRGKDFWEGMLQFLYPQQEKCLCCEKGLTENEELICTFCVQEILWVPPFLCQKCGRVLKDQVDLCYQCCVTDYSFDVCRGIAVSKSAAKLLFSLEHTGCHRAAEFISRQMAKKLHEVSWDDPVIIPVPSKKNSNNADCPIEMLAEKIGLAANVSVYKDVLCFEAFFESRQKKDQGGLIDQNSRYFVKKPEMINGRNIVLIDAKWGEGAVMTLCSALLGKAGSKRIGGLVFLTV